MQYVKSPRKIGNLYQLSYYLNGSFIHLRVSFSDDLTLP